MKICPFLLLKYWLIAVWLLGSTIYLPIIPGDEIPWPRPPQVHAATLTQESSGRLTGIVTNQSGDPLEGIEVQLYRFQTADGGTNSHWEPQGGLVLTDAAGAYQSLFLVPGLYKVHFSDPTDQYAFQYYPAASTLVDAATIVITAGQSTANINVQLFPGSTITGTINLYDGTPISQIEPLYDLGEGGELRLSRGSLLLSQQDGAGWRPLRVVLLSADSRLDLTTSTYTIGGLAAGRYRLSYTIVDAHGVPANSYYLNHCMSAHIGHRYAEYYPSAAVAEQALIVDVRGEPSVYPANIVIGGNLTYGSIEGQVTAANGAPLAGMIMLLIPVEAGNTTTPECVAVTNLNGAYSSPALPPGDYYVGFFDPTGVYAPAYHGTGYRLHGAQLLQLSPGATLTHVDVQLPRASQLVGTVQTTDGVALDGELALTLRQEPKVFEPFTVYQSNAYAAASGIYTVSGLPSGIYTLEYLTQHQGVYYSSQVDNPIYVEIPNAGEATYNFTLSHFDIPFAFVRGRVMTEIGEPLPGIDVTLYSPDGYPPLAARSDGYGRYQIAVGSGISLPDVPVPVTISFVDPAGKYAFAYYENARTLQSATPLTLTAQSDHTNINAALAPAGYITGHITLLGGSPLSQITPQVWDPTTAANYRGIITLYHLDGDEWLQRQLIKVGEGSSANFDQATNTYRFVGLAAGRYRVDVQTRYNEQIFDTFTDNSGALVDVSVGNTSQADILLGQDDRQILALYALALDNDPDRVDNLAPQLMPALESIRLATQTDPNKIAIVLADASGPSDTRIYIVRTGQVEPIHGLPDETLALDPARTEYNMADGSQIGHFLRWARNRYPGLLTTFSYVGHGVPLTPATTWEALNKPPRQARQLLGQGLFPLPARVDTYPSLTDQNPPALISPYELAVALRIGSNDGADPIQIADIVHCFSATIEELYELSPGVDPYAEIVLASPNYTYLAPSALGQALAAINTTLTAERMADKIIQVYDHLLDLADQSDGDDQVEHPRLLVAVNSRQVARLKQGWDQVAFALMQDFDVEKIRQAYLVSPKYDTTRCHPQDWELAPPDALSDFAEFAVALREIYGPTSVVGEAISPVLDDFKHVITGRYARNGTPWYSPRPDVFWDFDGHRGIALFTDLQGRPAFAPNTVELSWQSHWYTTANSDGDNPHPFAFIQHGAQGVTWADVLTEYWRRQGVTIETALCAPDPLIAPQEGELRATAIVYPISGTLGVGAPIYLAAAIQTVDVALKPSVQFNLYDTSQTLLFSDTVRAGYLVAGLHQIAASQPYTPAQPGLLTVEIIVDPDQQFTESNETDNRLTQDFTVSERKFQPFLLQVALVNQSQIVNVEQVSLVVQSTPTVTLAELKADLYQYTQEPATDVWLPHLVSSQQLDPAQPTLLLTFLQPGPVVAHLWAQDSDGLYNWQAAILYFNYAPATRLAAGAKQFYQVAASDAIALTLRTTSGAADLFAWSPHNVWSPDWRATAQEADLLSLPAEPAAGNYLVAVYAATMADVTLVTADTADDRSANQLTTASTDAGILTHKPTFMSPIVLSPYATTATAMQFQRIYLPMIAAAENSAAQTPALGENGQLIYRDDRYGFAFEYPARYAESPMREWGCGLEQHPDPNDGWDLLVGSDWVLSVADGQHFYIAPANGLALPAYVDQLIERLGVEYGGRDDQRLNREPKGYVVEASFQHHNNPFALFARDDKIYIFFARLSLACSDPETDFYSGDMFWQMVESFRFLQK